MHPTLSLHSKLEVVLRDRFSVVLLFRFMGVEYCGERRKRRLRYHTSVDCNNIIMSQLCNGYKITASASNYIFPNILM